jgi:DNA-binding NarL/FixJ family response regulator
MPRILLVEDHACTREALRRLIALEKDLEVVGEAMDGEQAMRMVAALQPDVLVCDLMLPCFNGIQVSEFACQSSPGTRILIISNHCESPYVESALKSGAQGYLDKADCTDHLAQAIRSVARNQVYLSPSLTG